MTRSRAHRTPPRLARLAAYLRGAALLAVAALALASCRSSEVNPEEQLSELQLRTRLDGFANHFSSTLQRATEEMVNRSGDPDIRRDLLRWQMFMIPACRRAVNGPDVRTSFVDVWTLCMQQRNFFQQLTITSDDESTTSPRTGRIIQEIGLQASDLLLAEIEDIGILILTPEQLDEAREDVQEFATENPIDNRYTRLARLPSSTPDEEDESFGWVDSIPLVGAFSGLDEGAKALGHLAEVAEEFTGVVEQLPEVTRWQTSLLLYELDEMRSVNEFVSAARIVADASAGMERSADRLATAATELPQHTQEVILATMARLEESQAELQKTLSEARATVDATHTTVEAARDTVEVARDTVTAVDGTLDQTEGVLTALDGAADSVTRAGEAWESMIRSVKEGEEDAPARPAPAAEEDSNFDPVEVGSAADSLTEAAVEIRGLVADVRGLIGSNELEKPLDDADARMRALVDHASVRALQLAGVVLVGLVLFRLLGRKKQPAS